MRSGADVDRLVESLPADTVPFVFAAVRQARASLPAHIPLIGFSGAPFTVASYLIEGGGSRHYIETKRFMYSDPGAWRALMERLVRVIVAYVNGQIAAGAQAMQLFDLQSDPGEQHDVAAQHPSEVARLKRLYDDANNSMLAEQPSPKRTDAKAK